MQMDGYYIWEPTSNDGNPYSYRRVWVSIEPEPEPQRTRRLIDTQYVPRKRTVARWPLTMLHISAVVLAIQIAAWFGLAITGSPYRLVVLASGAQAVVVWGIVMAWIIKELR